MLERLRPLCSSLRETSRAAETSAQVRRRLQGWLRPWHKLCGKLNAIHQQKTFPSGRNGSVRVDALRQSCQRHPGGRLLRAWRQYHASRCTLPSDRSFAVSFSDSARAFSDAPESNCSYGGAFRTLRDLTIRIVKFWSSAGDLVPYSQSSGS